MRTCLVLFIALQWSNYIAEVWGRQGTDKVRSGQVHQVVKVLYSMIQYVIIRFNLGS